VQVNVEDRLDWSNVADWERLGLDLMAQGRLLAMDWLLAGCCEERELIQAKAVRVLVRLAALEIADCREELRRRRRRGLRNDQLCISTLGRMTEALDGAHADLLGAGDSKAYMIQAVSAAKALRAEGLLGWFRYGPCAGLLLVAQLILEQRCFDFGTIDDLQHLTWCAKEIPFGEEPFEAGRGGAFAEAFERFKEGR